MTVCSSHDSYLGAQSIPVTLRSCWSRTASCLPPSRAYSTTYAQVLQCVAKCYKVSHIVTQCYKVVQSVCMFFLSSSPPDRCGREPQPAGLRPRRGTAPDLGPASVLWRPSGCLKVVSKLSQSCHCTSPGSDSVEVITKQLD